MVDFNRINLNGVNITPNVAGIRTAAAASTTGASATGKADSFERTNLFAGSGSSGVDYNAIAGMSLDDARAAIPGSFDGLRFLASI